MSATGRIGILLLDVGEPPLYDESTYYSFRDYMETLVNIGMVNKEFLKEDRGTVLRSRGSLGLGDDPEGCQMVDAWLQPFKGKFSTPRKKPRIAGIIRESMDEVRFLRKDGRGQGEPDFYEFYGFDVCRKWQMMGGASPFYEQSLAIKREVKEKLERKYGKKIVVRLAYGMDPVPRKEVQTPEVVIADLVKKDKITHLIIAEQFIVFTDVVNDFYLRKKVFDALKKVESKIPVSFTLQLGESEAFGMGIVSKVKDELNILPEKANVMVALSHHGLPPTKVGDYDGRKDSYQENSKRVFHSTRKKIMKGVKRKGRFDVVQVFVREMEDPSMDSHGELTPKRALDMAVSRKFDYYIDIPYEFAADGVHVLIKQRQAYGIDPPRWNSVFETNFPYKSLKAKITSAYFYPEYRTRAYYTEIENLIEDIIET